jgi:hypothetical protein
MNLVENPSEVYSQEYSGYFIRNEFPYLIYSFVLNRRCMCFVWLKAMVSQVLLILNQYAYPINKCK